MKLVIEKNLVNNNYEVVVSVTEIEEAETELFKDFGELVINVGGELAESNDEGSSVVIASFGDVFKKFPSQFPLTKVFGKAQFGDNAEKVANAYVSDIQTKIETAVTELKAKPDVFSGVTEVVL